MKITQRIVNFNVGMTADQRANPGFARVQQVKVRDRKLMAEFSTKAQETKTTGVTRFLYAPQGSSGAYNLYGYGVDSTLKPKIFVLNSGDVIGATGWQDAAASDESSSGVADKTVFFYYKNYIYGFNGTTNLWRFGDLTGTPTFTDAYQTISISPSSLAEPVHHSGDDCAYFFVNNVVYRLNNTTWNGAVLTLPDDLIITSAAEYGSYLAIACRSKSNAGNSVVFIWDRDSSLSTVTAKIDWGKGNLIHLANLDGTLVGVTDFFSNSPFNHNIGKMIIKRLNGTETQTLQEFDMDSASFFEANKIVIDDKLCFAAEIHTQGVMIHGVFSVDASGRVFVEVSEAEADSISTGSRYQGIYKIGNYWWLAHSGDGSVNRTDDQNTFTYTSILETNLLGVPDVQEQFFGATVGFEPLVSGNSVTLLYRKRGDSGWTTMKTVTTIGATSLPVVKDINSKAPVFHEIQYRIEFLGAVLTSFEYTHEVDDDKAYRIQPRRGLPF